MPTILIVEDKESSRYLLKTILASAGYNVIEASNGRKALIAAKKCLPDLIVSDVLMPVMDGFELCSRWMKDRMFCKIPFVFYSATYTHSRDKQLALDLGAARYLIKPMESEVILDTIKSILDQKIGRASCRERV